jgi:hypothetical protein
VLHHITIHCSLRSRIIELQKTDVGIFHIKRKMKEQETKHFRVDDKGILWFNERLFMPKEKELRNQIMAEAHSSKLSIHPGSSKNVSRSQALLLVDQNKERNRSLCC